MLAEIYEDVADEIVLASDRYGRWSLSDWIFC